jgi:hypothetical protein
MTSNALHDRVFEYMLDVHTQTQRTRVVDCIMALLFNIAVTNMLLLHSLYYDQCCFHYCYHIQSNTVHTQ